MNASPFLVNARCSNAQLPNSKENCIGLGNDDSASRVVCAPETLIVLDQRVIGPVTFAVASRTEAVGQILAALRHRSNRVFAFCNMHTYNMALRLPALANALATATVFNDGLGVDVASTILYGTAFPENLNGTDLMPALLASLERKISVFLVGSPPGVVEEAANALQKRYENVAIVGSHHGFFTPAESDGLVERIRETGTEMLVLGMGNPRQELWANEIAARTGAVVICVGAFLDFCSGRIPRAPRIVRALRSEWLYRLALEPGRLSGRYLGGAPMFLRSIFLEKWKRP